MRRDLFVYGSLCAPEVYFAVTGVRRRGVPATLHGQELSSPDIRAGMALLIAALAATGESTIANSGQIDRGYERVEEKLRGLGAQITRIED